MKPTYESPLASRYASRYMLHLFSPDSRFETWRKLCICLFGQRRAFAAKLGGCPGAAQLVGTSAGLSIPKRKPVHYTDLTDKNPEFYKRKDGFYDAHR